MMGLDFDIANRPDFATLCVRLRQSEQVFAEPGAMVSMDENISLSSGMRGGVWRSLGRALGGESVIMNTFTATHGPGEVVLAPFAMGDVVHHALDGNAIMLQRGAFSACSQGVEVSSQLDGLRGFFSGNGLILLRCSGKGDLFFNTYGGLVAIDVAGDYFVDTGYVVGFESTLEYNISVMPGLGIAQRTKAFLLGGEGFVCRFSGQGRLWIQTRAVPPLLRFFDPFRPVRKIKAS